MKTEDCYECDTIACWLHAVAEHPLMVYWFCRWLATVGRDREAEDLRRSGIRQAVSYCRTWEKMLET